MLPKPKYSINKELEVHFVGVDEPNNGRMLWKLKVKYKGKTINRLLFGGNWHYINFEIKEWQLEDEETGICYIPVEARARLIVPPNPKIIELNQCGLSTIKFIGNRFAYGQLMEIFSDKIVVTDLKKFRSQTFRLEQNQYIKNAQWIDGNTIDVAYLERVDGIHTVKNVFINF